MKLCLCVFASSCLRAGTMRSTRFTPVLLEGCLDAAWPAGWLAGGPAQRGLGLDGASPRLCVFASLKDLHAQRWGSRFVARRIGSLNPSAAQPVPSPGGACLLPIGHPTPSPSHALDHSSPAFRLHRCRPAPVVASGARALVSKPEPHPVRQLVLCVHPAAAQRPASGGGDRPSSVLSQRHWHWPSGQTPSIRLYPAPPLPPPPPTPAESSMCRVHHRLRRPQAHDSHPLSWSQPHNPR